MAGPSSTISLNSIVEVGIVDDIVGEIVTCGRVLRVALLDSKHAGSHTPSTGRCAMYDVQRLID